MKTKAVNLSEHLINACMELLPCLPKDSQSFEEETVINGILCHLLINAGNEYPDRQARISPHLKAYMEEKLDEHRVHTEKAAVLIEKLFRECTKTETNS